MRALLRSGVQFQSTLPARGATSGLTLALTSPAHFNPRSPHGERPCLRPLAAFSAISIHAPRTGSDVFWILLDKCLEHFNPRSPHGERRRIDKRKCYRRHFNPRSPHGERLFRQ